MRKTLLAMGLAILCTTSLISVSAAAMGPTIVKPADLKWSAMEGTPGAQMAVVYGDPAAAGTYTIRLKLAPGTKFPAHWHPGAERVTILSGTFLVGVGDKMDMAKMQALPAGTFVYLPAGAHHYAMAKTAVVLQSTGTGPFKINVVK